MTDTGQVPGEGLPENAGGQPGQPQPAAVPSPADAGPTQAPGTPQAPDTYTYLDPADAGAEDDDLLLMPGAQGAWGSEQQHHQPVTPPPFPQQAQPQQAPPQQSVPEQAGPYDSAPLGAMGYEPLPPETGDHESGGRDTGSVDVSGVRVPPTAAPQTPAPPRRPLHMGPPVPDAGGGVVRSLADRGPAGAPPRATTARPAPGPEYLDVEEGAPQADTSGGVPVAQQAVAEEYAAPGAAPMPGPQLGGIPAEVPSWDSAPAQAAPVAPVAAAAAGQAAAAVPTGPGAETVDRGAEEAAVADVTAEVAGPEGAEAAVESVPSEAVEAAPQAEQAVAVEPAQEAAAAGTAEGAQPVEVPQPIQAAEEAPVETAEKPAAGQDGAVTAEQEQAVQEAPAEAAAVPGAEQAVAEEAVVAEQGQGAVASGDVPAGEAAGDGPAGGVPPGDVPAAEVAQGAMVQAGQGPAEQAQVEQGQEQQAGAAEPSGAAEATPAVEAIPAAEAAPAAPVADAQAPAGDAVPAAVPGAEQAVAPQPEQAAAPEGAQQSEGPQQPADAQNTPEAPNAQPVEEPVRIPEQTAAPADAAPANDAQPPAEDGSDAGQPVVEQDGASLVQLGDDPDAPVVLDAQDAQSPQGPQDAPAEAAPEQPAPAAAEAVASAEAVPSAETPTPADAPAPAPQAETAPQDGTAPQDEATPPTDPQQPAIPAQPLGPPAAGYDDSERAAVHRVMRERRDIRNGFRSDPIPNEVLLRVLEAAHTAPSVGHSQPWDFVVIRSQETRERMHQLAAAQREAYAKSLPKARAKQFRELKIEAILETPVNIVVTADSTRGGRHTLGRHTQPQMAPYSSALAVENLWLAARAEGLGVGWVSFFDEREMVRELGLPEHLEVVAYLCVGYVDEFPDEPELMQAGWAKRRPLSWVVHEETYGRRALPGEAPANLLQETLQGIRPLDAKALGEAWERQKRMTKPAGALGMLEIISAQLCGLSRKCPPPIPEPAAVAVFAGDHGVHAQGVTPWPQEVTAQMVANFLGGGAVCNAFANQVGAEVCVVDVGVAADLPATPGLLPRKIRPGTADFTVGPAMSHDEVLRAIEVGIETARDLVAAGNKALITGEMGIANTTTSAALISVYTETDPAEVTGRGTGINDETHARKVDVVRRALELHRPDPADPIGVLAAVGGLEHAAMAGLILGGASLRTPVILDGVSAGAAALVARAIAPEALAACIAGHRSAEPGHVAALNKLGLRPLVDLDLRLGEGTGALLALPVVQSAARAMHEVATFDSAGVTEKG
ncbi:nicotinate-nucleotide--dimethylbenzimidazole phosphoribosyltransferase [Streptomyces rimosus]|uniref:nicotinate-nucleotide--dimethylbenzimidazole phosphoribosyltransferase n=1 Tax=Streptomyces rimosus TaxID=1927 RepID=UPI0004CAD755|nr:nicotinate-nucleotide--dimethylbenzimidazole phosphoribosyltransferase [Streptomyces rimosus]